MSERILIIEDDPRLANLIQVYLVRQGYTVDWHNSGEGAEEKIRQLNPDLVILDVMLPQKSGFDICRDIRGWFANYILIMTASEDNIDEIVGLELGADDYLAKPVEPRLLLARIRALLRRKQIENEKDCGKEWVMPLNNKTLIFDNLVIDGENRKVVLQEQEIDLTTAEFDLLWLLANNAGNILSRDDIFSQVRGIDFDGSDRSIDSRISRLRRKLLDDPDNPSRIKTVRGKGYLFMREGDSHLSQLLAKPLFFNRRIVFYLVILLSLQCIIAYGALLVFDSLPSSLTDMPDDHLVFRESQRGTVNLIRMRINENKNRPLQEVVDELQPYFGYPIEILPINTVLPHSVFQELKNLGFSFDSDKEVVYIDLNDGNLLQLGPIVMRDILQSNTMSLSVFLIIWALFSAIIFFILIYFAFSAVWKDLVNIRQTAEQLGQGNLKARTENVKGWLFKPLAKVLNNMGTHIEHLVGTNQTISHAMAHELRTPLARMRFELSMLEESNDEQEKLLLQKGMSDDINELETLISASLNYFKMQQSNIELNLTQVSLKQWVEKVCQSLALFKPKGFELVCNSQDVLAIIDTNLAETIVKNLLLNAFKYATHKAVLNITKQKNSVVIEIDDDGPGVPFEAREKIFMPFARLDTSRTRSTGGYGLGLAYVKLMAEFHDGNAFVVTSPLGGARFVISLKSNDC